MTSRTEETLVSHDPDLRSSLDQVTQGQPGSDPLFVGAEREKSAEANALRNFDPYRFQVRTAPPGYLQQALEVPVPRRDAADPLDETEDQRPTLRGMPAPLAPGAAPSEPPPPPPSVETESDSAAGPQYIGPKTLPPACAPSAEGVSVEVSTDPDLAIPFLTPALPEEARSDGAPPDANDRLVAASGARTVLVRWLTPVVVGVAALGWFTGSLLLDSEPSTTPSGPPHPPISQPIAREQETPETAAPPPPRTPVASAPEETRIETSSARNRHALAPTQRSTNIRVQGRANESPPVAPKQAVQSAARHEHDIDPTIPLMPRPE